VLGMWWGIENTPNTKSRQRVCDSVLGVCRRLEKVDEEEILLVMLTVNQIQMKSIKIKR
jgi:hypothetical protein